MTEGPIRPDSDSGFEPADVRGHSEHGELERLLAEAEQTVARLQVELRFRRRQQEEGRLAAQHAELDRLAEHLSRAQVHWGEVRSFFEAAIGELSPDHQGPPAGEHRR